jgi:hypothetical protein
MGDKNCTRCNAPLTPKTTMDIIGLEFCFDCGGYMRHLMNQLGATATYTVVNWHKQHREEVAKLVAWNAWAKGIQV